jgi:hypothetical protein
MGVTIENIGASSPEPISGLGFLIHYALRSDFTTVQEPPAFEAVGNFATKVTIEGDHVFAAGKGFNTIKFITESGAIETSPLGEKKRKIFKNTLTGSVAGSEAEVLGFMRMVKNEDFVVLFEELGTRNVRQIGSQLFPAEFEVLTHTLEALAEGNNALAITISDKQKWPAPVYKGEITTLPIVP